jgi:hypothetical protein
MTEAAPITDYERFLAALPNDIRDDCEAKLRGSGLAANHPVFLALAELYEKQSQKPARDFVQEAAAHSDLGQKLLDDLKALPETMLARLEPQLVGLMKMFESPIAKLDIAATSLQRNVEALPVLLLGNRPDRDQASAEVESEGGSGKWPSSLRSRLVKILHGAGLVLSDRTAWLATGTVSFLFWFGVSATVLGIGSGHLSRSYNRAFQERVAHMEADSVTNTITLNRLLALGLAIKIERGSSSDDWFLVLQGARKAAAPVDSPEGPAVEVWR